MPKNDSLFWFMGIVGPFFYKVDLQQGTISSHEEQFFLSQLAKFNLVDMWFYQDDATCYTTMNMLKDKFGEQLSLGMALCIDCQKDAI